MPSVPAHRGLERPSARLHSLLSVAVAAMVCLGPAHAETLSLADCLHEVVEHNPAVVQERLAIERAAATRLTLRARALPSLTVGGVLGDLNQARNIPPQKSSTGTKPGRVETRQQYIILGSGAIYQPLFDAGIPASYRRGTVGILAAEQNFYSVASAQLHAARLLYYQTLYQRQTGEVFRQLDESLAGNVKSQNQLVGAGLGGRGPLLSAQVQRANYAPFSNAAAGTYRTSLARLLQLMGRELPYHQDAGDPLGRITLSGALDEETREFDAAETARLALDRRPDLRTLRDLVKVEQEEANIAKAGFYPLIRLYVAGEAVPESNLSNQPNAVRQSDQVQTTEIRPGITGSWVVIDPGTTRGAVRAQEAQRDIVAISLRRLETNLPSEIANVRARLTDADAKIAALRGNVDTAQNTLNILRDGLAQGINSQIEFFYAQNDLLGLRNGLLTAKLEMSFAHAELDRLTGNYLRYVDDDPVPTARRPAHK